jgi:hypothetical protein
MFVFKIKRNFEKAAHEILVNNCQQYFNNWYSFAPFIAFYILMTIFIAWDGYFVGVARQNLDVAKKKLDPRNWKLEIQVSNVECVMDLDHQCSGMIIFESILTTFKLSFVLEAPRAQ